MKYEFNLKEFNDRDIAFYLLYNACGKVLAYCNLYPKDIFPIAYWYLNSGCKSREEYEYLVYTLIDNTDYRMEMLKWLIIL